MFQLNNSVYARFSGEGKKTKTGLYLRSYASLRTSNINSVGNFQIRTGFHKFAWNARSLRVHAFGSATYSPKVRHGALDENFMQIGLATSEDIQDWAERSYLIGGKYIQIGEVKKADTINYRTFKPEKDGLFCERIFGPVNDWICSCGTSFRGGTPTTLSSSSGTVARNSRFPVFNPITFRFAPGAAEFGSSSREGPQERSTNQGSRNIGGDGKPDLLSGTDILRSKGCAATLSGVLRERWGEQDERYSRGGHIPSICPQCQVEFTLSRIRRYRMGYIGLACSVTHIWYLNSRPNLFSVLFKMPTKYVKKITYYKGYTPSDPKLWNPCLGPGGDFFDTEWEFLHRWLGAREANSGVGVQSLTKSSQVVPGQLSGFIGSESSEGVHSTARVIKVEGDNKTSSELLSNSLESGYVATGTNLDGQTNHAASFSLFPGCTRSVRFAKKPMQGKIQENNLPSSLGLSPSWLENTGAQAFQKYLENRNWEKDFQKLQDELRRTPRAILSNQWGGKVATLSSTAQQRFKVLRATPSPSGFAPEEKRSGVALPLKSNTLTLVATHPYNTEAFLLKRRKKRVRSFKLLNIFRTAGGANCFLSSGLILDRIPVLPPELRPIVQLNAGQLASSDVNDLYRRVISRNNRLKYYLTGCGPHPVEFLVRSERHLVQLAVDALLENGKTTNVRHGGRGSTGTGSGNGPPYKSLSDRIGGKQGRFRQNLLGKRVDYSGRSVIVVGPKLKLHQCGLPYEMAMELFQAFLIRHIMELQLAKTIRGAKNLIRANQPLARQLLQNVVESHPILLTRAPTLHRLGIQAFQPKLISGRAIQLHPLVCTAFNADFDGDQMAVHVPLSPKSRIDARLLMLANTNWLSVATGQPSILPSQDMVLGFYYLTIERPSTRLIPSKVTLESCDSLLGVSKTETGKEFQSRSSGGFALGGIASSFEDVIQAYESGQLNLHTAVWVRSEVPPHHLGASMNTAAPPHRTKVFLGVVKHPLPSGDGKPNSKDSLNKAKGIEYSRRSSSAHGRSGKTPDEPLHLRISGSGTSSKLYTSYKWLEDSQERRRSTYIRTTPGRILVNNIIQSFIG